MNNPHKNIIGNLKKLEKVCASNTSLTDTAMNNPRKVDVTAISTTPETVVIQFTSDKSTIKEAKITGIKALIMPKIIAPVVFASMSSCRLIGASNNLSKDLLFLSNVIVTDNIEVVPNSMDRAMTPGSIPLISTSLEDLMKNIRVQDIGKIIPQLILGGLR
jgi:hypothetical protein